VGLHFFKCPDTKGLKKIIGNEKCPLFKAYVWCSYCLQQVSNVNERRSKNGKKIKAETKSDLLGVESHVFSDFWAKRVRLTKRILKKKREGKEMRGAVSPRTRVAAQKGDTLLAGRQEKIFRVRRTNIPLLLRPRKRPTASCARQTIDRGLRLRK